MLYNKALISYDDKKMLTFKFVNAILNVVLNFKGIDRKEYLRHCYFREQMAGVSLHNILRKQSPSRGCERVLIISIQRSDSRYRIYDSDGCQQSAGFSWN